MAFNADDNSINKNKNEITRMDGITINMDGETRLDGETRMDGMGKPG